MNRRPRTHGSSLVEVAKRAGVSTATVSRVLSGSIGVRAEKRQAVEKAWEELGFVRNGAARALALSRTMTVGAVVPTIENDGFARSVSHFQKALKDDGFTLLLASSSYDPEVELTEATLLLERGVDGLMLVGGEHLPALYRRLERQAVPFVQTWTLSDRAACVGFDNAAASRQAAEYLLDLGHTRFGVITGLTQHNDRATDRLRGVREALGARGLTLPSRSIVERSYGIAAGRDAARELLAVDDPPTAIICGGDQLAFGVIIEAQQRGIAIPGDLSVVGLNDADYAAFLQPALTTVRVSAEEIGVGAASYLLGAILDRPHIRVTRVSTELIVRNSTAPPRSARRR